MILQLFVGRSHLRGKKEALAPKLQAHLAYMVALEREGVLFASGPFIEGGEPVGEGLSIVRASSAASAQAVLDRDPFVLAGLRAYEVSEWRVLEGSFQVSVSLSDQTGALR